MTLASLGGLGLFLSFLFLLSVFYVLEIAVGVDYSEGPPVPISNTEVKLTGADNTWLATAWKDK